MMLEGVSLGEYAILWVGLGVCLVIGVIAGVIQMFKK